MSRKRTRNRKPKQRPVPTATKHKRLKPGEKVISFKKGFLECDSASIYGLHARGQDDEVCRLITEVLAFHERNTITTFTQECLLHVCNFVATTLALMADQNFSISVEHAKTLIARAHIFANLVAMTPYKTTDATLRHVMGLQKNFLKVLFLNTSRNEVRLGVKELFDVDPKLASIWTQSYQLPTIGCVPEYIQENLKNHFEHFDERWCVTSHMVSSLYFNVTYFAPEQEKRVKTIINRACMRFLGTKIQLRSRPNPKSIAIVTSKWFVTSAVYKSCAPIIKKLRSRGYKLTLIHTGHYPVNEIAASDFDAVKEIKATSAGLDLDCLQDNDFGLAYYPDVGMTDESVWLSNLRLAPKQATTYGHPASTWCDEMDYFIVGKDAEDLENISKHYSEELIVISGAGVVPEWPTVPRLNPEKRADKVIINCPWGPDKNLNSRYRVLRLIAEYCKHACEFHIYPSPVINRYNATIPFKEEVYAILGDDAVVHSDLHHTEYMNALEQGHLTLNSYPFGGYNTVVESLYVGVPVVTQEGDRFYNKVASVLLRSVGLDSLVTDSTVKFIGTVVDLIKNPDKLAKYTRILEAADLRKTAFSTATIPEFEKAFDQIIGGRDG